MDDVKQPAAKIRIGNVTAAIWKNDLGFYNVTLQKSYREKEGEAWKNTDSLGHADLLNAAKVLERCEEWMARK
jgi:hypothetical protein